MNQPSILVVPPKTLKRADRLRLNKQGVTVIETNDPSGIRFMTPRSLLDGDGLAACAVMAIEEGNSGYTMKKLVKNMAAMMRQKATAAKDEI